MLNTHDHTEVDKRFDAIPMILGTWPNRGIVKQFWHKEIARALKERDETAHFLFGLLDDIDTADDIAKSDDEVYRSLVRQAHKRRFEVASTDGYTVVFKDSLAPAESPEV